MADDDEDMGTSFVRQHRSEANPSVHMGGFGNNPRAKAPRKPTDMNSMRYWGKDVDLSENQTPQKVNQKAKRDFDPDGD